MKLIMTITLFLIVSSVAYGYGDWTEEEIRLEAAWELLHVVDWAQTRSIAEDPDDFLEMNPILGLHPSVEDVDIYMGLWMILHPVICHMLPHEARKAFQCVTIGMTSSCVARNFVIGVKVDF